MAIYSTSQDANPRTVILLWKANLEDPKFNQHDPTVQIVVNEAISRGRRRRRRHRPHTLSQTRIKFAAANEGDKQQLQLFCDACKGIPRATPAFLNNPQPPVFQATAPSEADHLDLAINASVQSAIAETLNYDVKYNSEASTSSIWNNSAPPPKWAVDEASSSGSSMVHSTQNNTNLPVTDLIPTAPPVTDEILDGPIHYPSIDSSPIDLSSQVVEHVLPGVTSEMKDEAASSSCVICLDAPVEGACVPCGHMCGCMECLNEVIAKKWGCPVCRAKINQVIRLYAV
jgi:ribosomal protein L44E